MPAPKPDIRVSASFVVPTKIAAKHSFPLSDVNTTVPLATIPDDPVGNVTVPDATVVHVVVLTTTSDAGPAKPPENVSVSATALIVCGVGQLLPSDAQALTSAAVALVQTVA